MMRNAVKIGQRRKANGYSIAEFGPAMGFLFIGVFFPLLDLMSLGLIYGCGFTLNNMQARQCAIVPKSEAMDPSGVIQYGIPQMWLSSGLGRFVRVDGAIQTKVTYQNGTLEASKVQDKVLTVTTTLTARPFLDVPLLPGVPGLTAPMTFTFATDRPLENPDDFNS
ncbi:unnamed protein product [Sphagnum jensenii]